MVKELPPLLRFLHEELGYTVRTTPARSDSAAMRF